MALIGLENRIAAFHMNYKNGLQIHIGDAVEFSGAKAKVVALGLSHEFSRDFPKQEWQDELGEGLLVKFDNGALLRLENPERDEDLKFIKRETQAEP